MDDRKGTLLSDAQDPVIRLVSRYPRIMVIRAAFELLRDGRQIVGAEMERILEMYLDD